VHFDDIMPFYMAVVSAVVFAMIVWVLGLCMTRILKKEALGFGDVKFFAMTGVWLGVGNLAFFCLMAGTFGVVFSVFWKIQRKEAVFPFGPALISALFLLLLT
ncbi:MAG: prepilin peptidase, partial [Alphaproteobacteria bacterium]